MQFYKIQNNNLNLKEVNLENNLAKKHTPQIYRKQQQENMSIYCSFFTPQTISIVYCLHECTKQSQQISPQSPLIQFLINKILHQTQQSSLQVTNQAFEAEMFSIVNDIQFLEQYRQALTQVNSFNTFYRELSNMLKTLRSLRNNKLQQGNVIDFLIRRLYIYFEKLDFKEIVNIYQNFNAYINGQPFKMRQNQFMLTKSIEEVKFNLENYQLKQNPEQINKILSRLSQSDHTFKTSYIKGLYQSQLKKPNHSMHELHRYFDRCLGNLFQQKTQSSPTSNKINHCILSTAYSSLKMNHLQQCLQSISQGLRISQNNNDQESINNCIIYLYKIAQQLGKYQEEILLAEHAITHSLNLNNITLMVYSCLCYSAFEKKYNTENSEVTLLKSRHINWTQALHFSKKKIYSTFQSNCKNIYHSFRSLLIPSYLHKLSILIHIPQLKSLLLNPYYKRVQLQQLQIYQQFLGCTSVDKELARARLHFNMNQQELLARSISRLNHMENQANSPELIVKIKAFNCWIKMQAGAEMDTYRSVQSLIATCKKYGFVKTYMVEAYNFISKILLKNQLYYDALVKTQQTIKFCEQNSLTQQKPICLLLKTQITSHLQLIPQSISLIQQLQQEGCPQNLSSPNIILFYQTKLILLQNLICCILREYNFFQEVNQLRNNQFLLLQLLLRQEVKQGSLHRINRALSRVENFVIVNPHIIQDKQQLLHRLKNATAFMEKVQEVYRNLSSNPDQEQYDEQKIHLKVLAKIKLLYFNQ